MTSSNLFVKLHSARFAASTCMKTYICTAYLAVLICSNFGSKCWEKKCSTQPFSAIIFHYFLCLFFDSRVRLLLLIRREVISCLKKISILSIKQKKLTSLLIAAWSKTKDFFYMSSVLLVHTMSSVVCYRRWKQITNKYFNRNKKMLDMMREKLHKFFGVCYLCCIRENIKTTIGDVMHLLDDIV